MKDFVREIGETMPENIGSKLPADRLCNFFGVTIERSAGELICSPLVANTIEHFTNGTWRFEHLGIVSDDEGVAAIAFPTFPYRPDVDVEDVVVFQHEIGGVLVPVRKRRVFAKPQIHVVPSSQQTQLLQDGLCMLDAVALAHSWLDTRGDAIDRMLRSSTCLEHLGAVIVWTDAFFNLRIWHLSLPGQCANWTRTMLPCRSRDDARKFGTLSMNKSRSRRLPRHSLNDLDTLAAVVNAGSFAKASAALGLTQSAVSRAIARLEMRLGVTLFRRTARSISLTDDGREFYETVAPHLAAIEDANTMAANSRTKIRGRLRVDVDAGIGQFVLTPRLRPFLERHPELDVDLCVNERMPDLVRDGFDLSIRFGVPRSSALKARLLLRTRVITCASPDYLTAHGTPRHPQDIEQHRCVLMRNPATGAHFPWQFVRGRQAVAVNVAGQLKVNELGPLLAACLAGVGVTQMLHLYAREALEESRLVQLLSDWSDETFPLYAYHHSQRVTPAKVRAFLDFVQTLTRT